MILPSEWLPAVLGEPEYETTGQARRITTLIMRLYNDIAAALGGDGQFAPLLMTRYSGSGETESGANLWCRGFIRGMALREKSWRVSDDELGSRLLPVLALGGTSLKNPLTQYGETRHRELVKILPESVANLYARMRRFNGPEMQECRTRAKGAPLLPGYDDAELAARSVPELLEKMVEDEDRVPRNVIDELARRGTQTLRILQARLQSDGFWSEEGMDGQWWLRLHAIMILGLLPDEEAGRLLVMAMRRMCEEEDENLQGWLSGYWPALFRNKPESVSEPLRALCEDRSLDWYMRVNAAEPVIAAAEHKGAAALNVALDWLARLVADEKEDWDLRLCAANTLLDFPRASYRPVLEALAARQKKPDVHFTNADIEEAYVAGRDKLDWLRFGNPWQFYTPAAIAARQARWVREDAEREQRRAGGREMYFDDEAFPPYIRLEPKIGRNDPCPCGSGKKFKKCHGAPDAGLILQ